ncbi:uncharacterized protein LOC106647185 [Copidosoma floridanum]|uniref:uncharacterized protein LOC106647185 n=1 Tax=Copidosoma floridanum TaxID=29053 RepID=UPI0006C9498A|nr:uncharacterized protein LOC106647185 [Copidosoma floridanum]
MLSYWNIITFTLILSYCASEVLGIKCYNCYDNGRNSDCRTNPNKTATIVECSSQQFSMQKDHPGIKEIFNIPADDYNYAAGNEIWNCMTVVSKDKNGETFSRSCAPVKPICERKEETIKRNDYELKRKCCDTDLCNSSFKTSAALLTVSACLLLIAFFGNKM